MLRPACWRVAAGKMAMTGFPPGWLRRRPGSLSPSENIYTPAALLQWLKAALGELDLEHTSHAERGVHYDLLRPTVFSEGFPDLTAIPRCEAGGNPGTVDAN